VFTSLGQLLNWYNTRDTNPTAWYPSLGGVPQKFNDLPTLYKANVTGNFTSANDAIQQALALNQQNLAEGLAPPCPLSPNFTDALECLSVVPFGQPAGATPFMSPQDLSDLQCFLETLTDGYVQGVTPQDPNCIT
jgi:cytochrome c peroxidase